MKRIFFFVLLLAALALVASAQVVAPVTAPAAPVTIDPIVVAAILALLGSGIVTALVQAIKTWLKIQGGWAMVLAAVLSIGASAYVLIQQNIFTMIGLVIYSAVVFGSSTGLFKLTAGAPAK